MRIATSVAIGAFLATSVVTVGSAFTPSFIQHQRHTRDLRSTVLEDAPTTTSGDGAKKVKNPTRFDRLKQTYKGPRPSVAENVDIDFSYEEFAKAVDETEYLFERNSVVEGVAVEYSQSGCLVDIGAKASAFLPEQEAALAQGANEGLEDLIPLETPMEFQIISDEDENGQLLVSVKRIQYKKAWEDVQVAAQNDEIFDAEVIAVNRGGAICRVKGLRAFLPGSHLAGQLPDENLIGQTLQFKFLEVDPENGKLVVSNRKAVVETQMAELSRGDVVNGMVKALKPYGAFVEVGGMSGLLHISQISYDRIEDLEKVLHPGMQVKCMIIDHDKANGRIALSTKTLEPEAGAMLKDPQSVFDHAEETAIKYHAKMEKQREAREMAAREIVLGLGDSLDGDAPAAAAAPAADGAPAATADPLQDVADSLDSLLS